MYHFIYETQLYHVTIKIIIQIKLNNFNMLFCVKCFFCQGVIAPDPDDIDQLAVCFKQRDLKEGTYRWKKHDQTKTGWRVSLPRSGATGSSGKRVIVSKRSKFTHGSVLDAGANSQAKNCVS